MRFLATLFTLLASVLTPAWAQNAPFPPSPKQLVAVNPVTNKVYVANEFANTVTVLDQTNNTTATIPVGNRPQFIVVNPLTNRIFVNNGGAASMTVIDGATDTNLTPTPLPVGSQGPMAINNETNVVFIVRMTSVATDEVTFFNATDNNWYTIATESFQPTAVTINPVTNTLYVAHYGTGDVRVISGEYNNTNLHPPTFSIPAWSKPFAIAANSMTNKIYVITEDSRGPIGVINGATNMATWLTPAAGHAAGPKALAVNPVTNKIYAAFANEVVVIDGGNNSLAYVPVPTGSVASIAINHFTNKVYVSSDGGNLTVIDGFTNATTALTVPGGTVSIGMNPMTNEIITGGSTAAAVDGVAAPFIGLPLTTTITPLPGNAGTTSGSITMSASNGFPNPLPVRGVYYQFDSIEGRWTLASGAGNGPWTAALSGLSSGSHTIYAFAAEAHMAPTDTGNGSSPMFGNITSYAFTVTAATGATVTVASSVNPSTVGQSVTFTATVTGSSGTPTGTVTFLDGSTPLCSAVALASGSATCTTSALAAGSRTINANYSGNSSYGAASGSVTQTVNKLAASVSLGSAPNPSTPGQSVTITATVTGSGAVPTGTVTFLDGTTTLCSAVTLASGSATCATSSLSTGAHTLNANYSGNGTYNTASGTATHNVGTATATVGVTSSVNPSNVGQSVTFTATVSGSSGTTTGTVTFSDGATTLCSAVALASGSAACTTSALVAGSRTITAAYSGSTTYGAKSATVTQTVNKLASTVAVGSTPNPSTPGQSVTITATVTGSGGTPTGSVNFTEGATTLCSAVALNGSGAASCTTSSLSSGAHTLTASYSGNATYNTGSGSTTHNVNTAAATVNLTSSVNPSSAGQTVSFTAVVSGSGAMPTGTVNFTDGGAALCTGISLATGSAVCTTNTLGVGSHTITASYSGSATYGAASSSVTQTVNKTNPTISGSASPNSAEAGAAVTLTAILGGSAGAPTGTVDFLEGSAAVPGCSARPISGDRATCTVSNLPNGSHTLTARYSGNASYSQATSAPFTVTVSCTDCPPAAPAQQSPNGTITTQTPAYTWSASAGATSYWLLVQNLNGVAVNRAVSPAEAGCSGGGTCTFNSNAVLANGSMWGWYVKAYNANGESAWSAGMTFTVNAPGPTPPSKTSGISPRGEITTSRPTYTWNVPAGATSYTLLVQNLNGVAVYETITPAQANCGNSTCSYTPNVTLPGGSTWGWYVKSANSIGESAWSDGLLFNVNAPGPSVPAAPVQSSPSGTVTTNMPTYQWAASSGATAYWLQVQNLDGVAVNRAVSATEAGCSNGGTCSLTPNVSLPNHTMWGWYVKAANSLGESAWSSGMTFTVDAVGPSAPAAPTQVSPSGNITTTMPTYTWNASAGATSYYIVVQNLNSVAVNITLPAASVGCGSGTGTCTYTPSQALSSNTTWGWYVRAINDVGASGYSAGMQFHTP